LFDPKNLVMYNGVIEMSEDADRIKIRIDYLVNIIANLSASQRQLTGNALDLQSLALAKKRQIKDSIDRAVELGEIQEIYIKLLMELSSRLGDFTDNDDCNDSYRPAN
jgi:hypothetical protein